MEETPVEASLPLPPLIAFPSTHILHKTQEREQKTFQLTAPTPKKNSASDMPTQISHLSSLRQHLPTPSLAPTSTFHRTYRHTFRLALTTGQRTLPLDTAVEYFRLLLAPPGLAWNTPTTPWLDLWLEYLTEKWKKAINKDVWEQTGVFVVKSLEDESMGWWSEEGAWPSCLDEFVAFVRSRRGEGQGGEGDGMEL